MAATQYNPNLPFYDAPPASPGDTWENISTPALIVDLDVFERNLDTLRSIVASKYPTVKIRAHAKAHKCPELAKRQIEYGSTGVCCQKLSEAEAMIAAGINDVFLSNEIVDPKKLKRLVELAKRPGVKLSCCVDNAAVIDKLAELVRESEFQGLRTLVEVDVGQNRCGVLPSDALPLVKHLLTKAPYLQFAGLHCYHGANQHIRSSEDRRKAVARVVELVKQVLDDLSKENIKVDVITGGGTGTFEFEASSGIYTEIQPGSYAFMDVDYGNNLDENGQFLSTFKNSLVILTTVMSDSQQNRGWVVVDAGLKAHSIDSGAPRVASCPLRSELPTHPAVEYVPAGDEHGKIVWKTIPEAESSPKFQIGDKLLLIPGHCDPTINMYSWIVGMRKGVVEGVYPIARNPGQ